MENIITINFQGKNIKNALDKKNGIKSKRGSLIKWDNNTKEFLLNEKNHINIINNLYENNDLNGKEYITKELKKKIDSYKTQDIKKKRYNEDIFISLNELIYKLKKSELKCHYCLKKVKLVYENVRDPEQWTLDRIDNNICHTDDNTVVADLKCNLQRRLKDDKKFLCDKQLTITMIN